jgi:hypothetical protein
LRRRQQQRPELCENPTGGLGARKATTTTRIIAFNQTFWPMQPYWWGSCGTCRPSTRCRSIGIGSFDYYPLTNPNLISYDYHYPGNLPSHYYATKSDFLSVPNDTLWVQAVATQALVHAGNANQPAWAFIEAGGDALASGGYNNFPGAASPAGRQC